MNRRSFQQLLSIGMFSALGSLQQHKSTLVKPAKLRPGDKVGLIAPGSSIPEERIIKASQTTEMLELVPVLGDFVYESNGYLAGTDEQRLQDLHRMFSDKDIKAVWCIRGGYGCTRLLPLIDYKIIKQNPKIFIGYSDITALHLAMQKECGLVTYHGPVASSQPTSYSIEALKKMIFEGHPHDIMPAPITDEAGTEIYTIREGQAEGKLTGGNLSLLAALVGTRWCPSYAGKIVFIEDIGEKPYRIDRMLVQLLQSTDLAKAAGVILGQFNDCEGKPGDKTMTLRETLYHQFKNLNMPVFYGFSFGHIDDNCTLPLGIPIRFDTREKKLTTLEKSTS
jgi:muramoyltetrapeptide carboxypeptidase